MKAFRPPRESTPTCSSMGWAISKKGYRGRKAELLDVIGAYQKGYVPLIVPTTLINHYVRKYREPYLKRQHYFNPYPVELMLRNHA
jgi:uncharacterized protein YbgA (DUF1722 family)